ncbi:peptidase M23 [Streptomyces sp. A012304]|uniref:peptidase M23 n=1 Tax=Streptomyces sp. A012304 TaxID=375446 RepID=UPI002232ACF7|nr:peptidase M23 [Streptomyces sp. A012304]GKQ35074.1 hypothetical protein ALMP_16210 [Streptomyces sp. A012304]
MSERTSRLRRAAVAAAAMGGAVMSSLGTAPAHAAADTTQVYVWATDVNMRTCASRECPAYGGVRVGRMTVDAYCQEKGQAVTDGPYANDWWVKVEAGGPIGWISAVYVRGGDNWQPIPGVSQDWADCF